MKYDLSNICSYGKEKIGVNELTKDNYISTENMVPNKSGVTESSALPNVNQVQKFEIGDVLVSNIRPYFKKIWFADKTGGCSNDVLVFRSKENVDKRYLYYVLANDEFFDYSMATSKGTKMPRGDKASIMAYKIEVFDTETQQKIGSVLNSFDKRIALNERINKNLYA